MKRGLAVGLLGVIVVAVLALWWSGDGEEQSVVEGPGEAAGGPEAGVIEGRVVDDGRRPVEGAVVTVGHREATTDEAGWFRLGQVEAGEVELDVEGPGVVRPGVGSLGRKRVEMPRSEGVSVELVVPREASVSGRVVADGRGVEGASLSLQYAFADGIDGRPVDPFIVSDVVESGGRGEFSLGSVAPGRLQILVEAEEFAFWESEEIFLRPGQVVGDLELNIAPAAGFEGVVVGSDGSPIERARVVARDVDGRHWVVRTSERGLYRLEGLSAGRYVVEVSGSGYGEQVFEGLVLDDDEVRELDVVLESQDRFFGRVVDSRGEPVPAARVFFEQGSERHVVQANEMGVFWWDEPGDGVWTVRASSPRFDGSERQRVRPGEEVVLELGAGGYVRGRVVDSRGRGVSAQVRVGSAQMDRGEGVRPQQFAPGRSDEDGRFRLGPLPSGRYRLVVEAEGWAPLQSDSVRVRGGAETREMRFVLEAGESLEGVVVDGETGEPVVGATVRYLVPNAQSSATTDGEGRFVLGQLPSGRQSVQVGHGEYVTEHFTVTLPTRAVTFALTASGGEGGFAFHGIGAVLGRGDDGFDVIALTEDSAAALSGVEVGDRVVAVDGRGVQDLMLEQVVEMLRGNAGEGVRLTVERPGRGRMNLEVVRERVMVPQRRQ